MLWGKKVVVAGIGPFYVGCPESRRGGEMRSENRHHRERNGVGLRECDSLLHRADGETWATEIRIRPPPGTFHLSWTMSARRFPRYMPLFATQPD